MPFNEHLYNTADDDKALIAKANEALDRIKTARVPRVQRSGYPGLASHGLATYRQAVLYRINSLADTACSEWNSGRPVGAVVAMRAFVENIAGYHHTLMNGHASLKSGDLLGFHDGVMKALFGAKGESFKHPDMPVSTNVLTLVGKLEKTATGASACYDTLCEIVHPNALGLLPFAKPSLPQLDYDFSESGPFIDVAIAKAMIAPMLLILFAENELSQTMVVIMPMVQELERKHGPSPQTWPAKVQKT